MQDRGYGLPRTHLLLSSSVTLKSARGRRGVPPAVSPKSYRVSSRSKRTSQLPELGFRAVLGDGAPDTSDPRSFPCTNFGE